MPARVRPFRSCRLIRSQGSGFAEVEEMRVPPPHLLLEPVATSSAVNSPRSSAITSWKARCSSKSLSSSRMAAGCRPRPAHDRARALLRPGTGAASPGFAPGPTGSAPGGRAPCASARPSAELSCIYPSRGIRYPPACHDLYPRHGPRLGGRRPGRAGRQRTHAGRRSPEAACCRWSKLTATVSAPSRSRARWSRSTLGLRRRLGGGGLGAPAGRDRAPHSRAEPAAAIEAIDAHLAADLRPAIGDPAALEAWCARSDRPFHLEIDTGMARAGIRWNDAPRSRGCAALLGAAPGWEGAFTHFHCAETDPASTARQWERFQACSAPCRAARPRARRQQRAALCAAGPTRPT